MAGRPHDRLEELIVADVLDALDDADREELAHEMGRHGPACEECRRLLVEYGEVAARLALALDPMPVSPGARVRLMAAIGDERTEEAPTEPAEEPEVPTGEGLPEVRTGEGLAEVRPLRPLGWARRWVGVAAAAAVLVFSAGAAGYLVAPDPAPLQQDLLAFVSHPDARIVPFEGRRGQRLAVAFREGERRAFVVGANLPAPPEGKVYELWYRPEGKTEMLPAGLFAPAGDGVVVAAATVGRRFDALAVSVEPEGGSERPTTEPVFLTTL